MAAEAHTCNCRHAAQIQIDQKTRTDLEESLAREKVGAPTDIQSLYYWIKLP